MMLEFKLKNISLNFSELDIWEIKYRYSQKEKYQRHNMDYWGTRRETEEYCKENL
jgi:hypothetical protein